MRPALIGRSCAQPDGCLLLLLGQEGVLALSALAKHRRSPARCAIASRNRAKAPILGRGISPAYLRICAKALLGVVRLVTMTGIC